MAKRGQGEGTISKRMINGVWDGTWWARITVGKDENGKQKRKAFYGKTRKEVQEKLNQALNDINTGIYIEPSKMTLGQWLDIWMKMYRIQYVKPSTVQNNSTDIRLHIVPVLGHYSIKDIRRTMIQDFINKCLLKGLSGVKVLQIYNTLNMALKQAVINELLVTNPASNIQLPRKERKEAKVLTVEEQERLIDAAKFYRAGSIFVLILYTGMRIGEALGLTWDDVNFEEKYLSINKGLVEYVIFPDGTSKRQLGIGDTKTKSSKRRIPLIPEAIQLLNEHKRRQEVEKEVIGYKNKNNGCT